MLYMAFNCVQPRAILIASFCMLLALYFFFFDNPLVMDDFGLFDELSTQVSWNRMEFGRRTISLSTFWIPSASGIISIPYHRAFNLGIHFLVGLAIYSLSIHLYRDRSPAHIAATPPVLNSICVLSALSASLFLLHPVTTYSVAYLIQRSILLATFFSLLMLIACWIGYQKQNRNYLLLSCVFYFLAVFSKENAVVAAPCAVALLFSNSDFKIREVGKICWLPFLCYGAITIAAYASMPFGAATVYETDAAALVDNRSNMELHIASAFNQMALFWKYLLVWIVPSSKFMSIDLREPVNYALPILDKILLAGAFLSFGIIGAALLLQRRRRLKIVGLAMTWVWISFLPELAAIRIQETFVLYRSYLWMAFGALCIPAILALSPPRVTKWLAAMIMILYVGISFDRLLTFSDPIALWSDALTKAENSGDKFGLARIYRNRGIVLLQKHAFQASIDDFTQSIRLMPTLHAEVYDNRGLALANVGNYGAAIRDFDYAIALKPNLPTAYYNRALYENRAGRNDRTRADLQKSCELKLNEACTLLKTLK